MSLSNHERIGRALESARAGLLNYVTDEMERAYGSNWRQRARESLPNWQRTMGSELVLDIQALIAILLDPRHECFTLLRVPRPRTLLFDLREIRNTFAHQKEAGNTYTNRALDTVELLLEAVKAPQSTAIRELSPDRPRPPLATPVPASTSARSSLVALRPDSKGRERGQCLFRYLAAQANKGRAVGISYDQFISFLHGKPQYSDVMNRNYAQSDTNRIIDIAPNVMGLPGFTAYAASKAAVRNFARGWTMELKDRGIRVNSMSPGAIDTPALTTTGLTAEQAEQAVAQFTTQIPMGRRGKPEEIAAAVVFLASELEDALKERVTTVSLLRSVTKATVKGQFRRIAIGGARLSHYSFAYDAPAVGRSKKTPVSFTFDVEPESQPPTNIHVIIGRNGVGKTHLLNAMSKSDKPDCAGWQGVFTN